MFTLPLLLIFRRNKWMMLVYFASTMLYSFYFIQSSPKDPATSYSDGEKRDKLHIGIKPPLGHGVMSSPLQMTTQKIQPHHKIFKA